MVCAGRQCVLILPHSPVFLLLSSLRGTRGVDPSSVAMAATTAVSQESKRALPPGSNQADEQPKKKISLTSGALAQHTRAGGSFVFEDCDSRSVFGETSTTCGGDSVMTDERFCRVCDEPTGINSNSKFCPVHRRAYDCISRQAMKAGWVRTSSSFIQTLIIHNISKPAV